MKGETRNS